MKIQTVIAILQVVIMVIGHHDNMFPKLVN